jgi:hypothetical protein
VAVASVEGPWLEAIVPWPAFAGTSLMNSLPHFWTPVNKNYHVRGTNQREHPRTATVLRKILGGKKGFAEVWEVATIQFLFEIFFQAIPGTCLTL